MVLDIIVWLVVCGCGSGVCFGLLIGVVYWYLVWQICVECLVEFGVM